MRFLSLVLVTLFVTGCASPVMQEGPLKQSWSERREILSHTQEWNLSGRLAVKNGKDSWQVTLYWSQQRDDYRILLSGPFGTGRVMLVGDAHGVVLRDADGHTFYSSEAEVLLYQQTGMRLPLRNMRYWVLGLPGPGSSEVPVLDSHERVATLQQEGWSIVVKNYVVLQQAELPQKIFMQGHDLDVRLVIDEWHLGRPSSDSPLFSDDSQS